MRSFVCLVVLGIHTVVDSPPDQAGLRQAVKLLERAFLRRKAAR